MPLFYFDVCDGEDVIRDEDGTECPSFEAARRAALGVLPAMARDAARHRDQQDLVILLRDNGGRHVFTATLTIMARDEP